MDGAGTETKNAGDSSPEKFAPWPHNPFLLKALVSFGAILLPGGLYYLLRDPALTGLPSTLYRSFYWENSLDFIMGWVGLVLLTVYLLHGEESIAALIRRGILRGLTAVFLAAFILGVSLYKPADITWINESLPLPVIASSAGPDLPALERSAVAYARSENKPVFYYFHADWCAACPDFERFLLRRPDIATRLKGFVSLKMDCQDIERWSPYLEKTFGIRGLPAIAFRNSKGVLIREAVLQGANNSSHLLHSLLDALTAR